MKQGVLFISPLYLTAKINMSILDDDEEVVKGNDEDEK